LIRRRITAASWIHRPIIVVCLIRLQAGEDSFMFQQKSVPGFGALFLVVYSAVAQGPINWSAALANSRGAKGPA
jgi:hypothetical protein